MAAVTVIARYADCSVWTSPCCKRTVDDRAGSHALTSSGCEQLGGLQPAATTHLAH